jgi:Uma2 family endonuclease
MTLAIEKELTQDPRMLYRISTEGYHRMIELEEIEEGAPFELLDGYIVRKIRSAQGEDPRTINPNHATAVSRLVALNNRLTPHDCYMRVQQPISLPPFDEPEPDGAIVRGKIEDYQNHHPGPKDVLCVIEVADASLKRDRGYKRELYARVGIACVPDR